MTSSEALPPSAASFSATGANDLRWWMLGPEPGQRLEMLGHAVAHVALEAVAGMRKTKPRHQPVARHLGNDGGGGDR